MNTKNNINFVIDCLAYPILVIEPDGMLISTNKATTLLFGQQPEAPHFIWEVDWWSNPDLIKEKWRRACQSAVNGNRIKFIETIVGVDRQQRNVSFLLSPMTNEQGKITHIFIEVSGPGIPSKNSDDSAAIQNAELLFEESIAQLDANLSNIPGNVIPSQKTENNQSQQQSNYFSDQISEVSTQADALQDSERKFRLMVESIEDYAMFMVDLDGFITSWNRGAERLTGYSDIEAIGRHFSMLYPQQSQNKEHAAHELAMAQANGRYEEEGLRVRKNGTHYHAQIIVWRVEDANGKTVGYAKITRDITALKEAKLREAQLFESENRFRLMVDSIQDYAMFMVDLKGNITTWNRGAERLTGYTEQEALGRPFSILYPKNEISDEHAIFELAMAREKGYHEEEGTRVKKDGSLYHAQIIVWPVADKNGEIVRFAKITRDITAQKKAQFALKESEAKFRTMTDAMPQIVWSALPDGRNDYVNHQWYQFTGTKNNGSSVDQEWFNLIHPDERTQVNEAWQQCVLTAENFEAQFRLRHVSGEYRWTLGRALPVLTDGTVTRWMGTLTDIHEQKHAEANLHESARRKDEYLAMLAHELRNPLAPIRNSTLLLRKITNDDTSLLKSIDVIDRQVVHMTRLIDDLLDVARISRGKVELRRETFEFGELIRHTANDFKTEYDLKGVELTVDMPSYLMWIYGDRIRIAQAIGNLLHNALKFTDAAGRVSVSLNEDTRQGKSFGVVKVNDTGIGIEPELLGQLFEPFVQGHQDLARSKGGLGLGLALIRGFANLHGGHVYATSEGPGCGAEFVFAVPLSTAPRAHHHPASAAHAVECLKVILIDDNKDMVETLSDLLTMDGHQVKCAYDGESGFKLIQLEKPDLVFCDIGLPGQLDGYAVARSVRADPAIRQTFIVALSGYGLERDRRLAFEAGFNEHLLKPIDFAAMDRMVKAAHQPQ